MQLAPANDIILSDSAYAAPALRATSASAFGQTRSRDINLTDRSSSICRAANAAAAAHGKCETRLSSNR
jgi:hypothetical protein